MKILPVKKMLYGIYEANRIRSTRLFLELYYLPFVSVQHLSHLTSSPCFRFPVEFNFQVTAWLGMEFVSPVSRGCLPIEWSGGVGI